MGRSPDQNRSLLDIARSRIAYEKAERDLLRAVERAREIGCSWQAIGQALGTTKQAAWERFRDRAP